jgi:4'-phosphopantetheinyl transferase EntD
VTADIQAALRDMLGPDVGIGITDPRAPTKPLMQDEVPAMTRAIPKRVAEFTAGREAARAAMAGLGLPQAAIPMGDNRAPLWPAGLVGSIAHMDDLCIAAVSENHQSLGIDVEPATPLEQDLWDTICTTGELAWLHGQPNPGLAAKMIFCAKEAIYKAQYPLTGRTLDFQDVEILLVLEPVFGSFTAHMGTLPVTGHLTITRHCLISAVSLRASNSGG